MGGSGSKVEYHEVREVVPDPTAPAMMQSFAESMGERMQSMSLQFSQTVEKVVQSHADTVAMMQDGQAKMLEVMEQHEDLIVGYLLLFVAGLMVFFAFMCWVFFRSRFRSEIESSSLCWLAAENRQLKQQIASKPSIHFENCTLNVFTGGRMSGDLRDLRFHSGVVPALATASGRQIGIGHRRQIGIGHRRQIGIEHLEPVTMPAPVPVQS